MQRSENEAIRTKIQQREITNITNSQIQIEHMVIRVSSYFPKGVHSATETELKIVLTHVSTETLTPKTGNSEPQQNYRLGTVSNELLGGGG